MLDQHRDRYQLLPTGWLEERRVYGTLIHIDLAVGFLCLSITYGDFTAA
jgi:hypothetical protein